VIRVQRKLVSIQTINALEPIAGADHIEAARVMGWTVVVKRGEFAVGDLCLFFEIDSVLPDGPAWSEFMRPRGFRVRTIRLRGVLSQGLALPVFPVSAADGQPTLSTSPDVDLAELLGVTKFEPVVPDARDIAGPFPAMVPKTDEIRLQSALGVLSELRGLPFYVSVKLDGESVTYANLEDGLVAASRNWAVKLGGKIGQIAERYRLAEKIPSYFAIQGELCGPGIRNNRLGLGDVDFFVFSVYDVRSASYLSFSEFISFCADRDLATVPIERIVRGDEAAGFDHDLAYWLEAARGLYAGTKQRREGIVVRPLTERRSATLGGRLSFKVINNDFLLKDEE